MSDIVPSKQSVLNCLSNRKYDIDFYQREYVWSKNTVDILLNDIIYSFNIAYDEHKDEDFSSALIDKFNWYYLNVFITNNVDGKMYIVDGQQRLSTLTLISVYLYHKCNDSNLKSILQNCIASTDMFNGKIFNIDHGKRQRVMQAIFDGINFNDKYSCQTEQTIIERYKDIEAYFNKLKFDNRKLKVFIGYFLNRLVLVELTINKDDTPMVFEVINDRGESLKPFEILKGKLIGILAKTETEKYNTLWEDSLKKISGIEDSFFLDYIKSKFIFKRNSDIENSINNEYHRYLFAQNEISEKIGFLRQNPNQIQSVKHFIETELVYYSSLYKEIKSNCNEYLLYCNKINSLNGVYQNIMSACSVNDKDEKEKILQVSKEYDRLYMLLQLNKVYDSNKFLEISYSLNEKLQNSDLTDYRKIFNDIIIEYLKEKKNKDSITSILDYETFSKNSYESLSITVLKYVIARVENYICRSINQDMQFSVLELATKNSDKTGFHVEHIFSKNETNKSYFESNDEFEEKRNYIGGLLILKGRSNISSGNEDYSDKLKTYSNSLIWGHSLCKDFYHAQPDFRDFNDKLEKELNISFKPIEKFDKDALKYRSRLLYEIVKKIWEI